jgi:pimeloyl-ACP methyl ester carboxylesterase
MSNRIRAIAIASIIGAMVLSFFNSQEPEKKIYNALDQFYTQQLDWSGCYENFECTELTVPINYRNIKAGTFQISVLRYKAQDPARRLGAIIVNPGGPGASGVDYAYNAEYLFDPDLTDRYDIVGFDPRGVSRSEPIICLSDEETDANYAADSKPDNDAEFEQAIVDSKDFLAKCEANTPHLTAYSTANAARDMDILRAALGEKKLNYMGKSYGTFMGALYAYLFPDKIGRVVLDGAVDPTVSNIDQTKNQAVSFDNALNAFIKDCATKSNCPLPKDQKAAIDTLLNLWSSAATNPLKLKNTKDDRTVSESLLVIGTASALYDSEEGWPQLRQALREALTGYGDTYLELADNYTGRQPDGTYRNNEFDAGAIIDCLDFADARSAEKLRSDAETVIKAAPVFGPYIALSGLTCEFLTKPTPVQITKTTTNATIVIVGTTGDPATPYEWAQGLHKLLPNSALLTFVGDGHTGQGRGNACIDDAVNAYYLSGEIPAADLRCTS